MGIRDQISGIRDLEPRSEIRDPEKPIPSRIFDPGVKQAPDPGTGSATLLDHKKLIWH
jgi:hypothetical protein